ncbi:MAG: hypothetical protein HY741_10675 [Chloroflexi bacterium]|nr:hypothetical protein [Chloroflexota bacterium]
MKTQSKFAPWFIIVAFIGLALVWMQSSTTPPTHAENAAVPEASPVPWYLKGNNIGANNYLGTKNDQPLVFKVNKQRALKLEPNSTSPNIIGGYKDNSVTSGAYGATVGGGGRNGSTNRVTDDYGTVGGGMNNQAGDNAGTTSDTVGATVGGGASNTAGELYATVSGGGSNTASNAFATVGGGFVNSATGLVATVPGGEYGSASHYGEMAYASGKFVNSGDAQTSVYILRNTTTDAGTTELFLDGIDDRLTVASGRRFTFDILVIGSAEAGATAGYHIRGVIKNIGSALAFVGAPAVTTLGEDDASWNVDVNLNNLFDALIIHVNGTANTTVRWVATVRTAEVAW